MRIGYGKFFVLIVVKEKNMIDPQLKQQYMIEAKTRYLNGEDTQRIARSFLISGETVRCWLKEMGVTRRNTGDRNRIYTYDANSFKIPNIDSAYFAGLLLADGNINKKKTLFQIEIDEKDSYILEEFKHFIKYTGEITTRTRIQKSGYKSTLSALRITAPDVINDLINIWGVVPQKSKIATLNIGDVVFDNTLEEFFFRGLFDGDGCIHIRKNNHMFVSLAGHPCIIDSFRDWCWKKIRMVGSLNKRSEVTHVVMFGSSSAIAVMNLLYSDERGSRLWRKQNLI